MSPTVFRYKEYRFFFFSREELRPHIHVLGANGEAKYWIEPTVELANSTGFNMNQLNDLNNIIEEHKSEIKHVWKKHFGN